MLNTLTRNNAACGPLETYLHEIDETPLLGRQEEVDLFSRIEDGDAEARDHVVRANLRLVVHVARKFLRQGVALEDLIAEGNLGLLHAVECFDLSMNTRFSTYACYWIKQSIRHCVNGAAKAVRLPAYMQTLMNKWRRATTKLQDGMGRAPTEEEVIDYLGLSHKKLKIIKKALRIYNSCEQGGQDEEFSLDETLEDPRCQAPDAAMAGTDELRQVLQLVDRLEPREASVIRLRFGLEGKEPQTLLQIGDQLGLTRERVRQIERQALAQLAECLVGA